MTLYKENWTIPPLAVGTVLTSKNGFSDSHSVPITKVYVSKTCRWVLEEHPHYFYHHDDEKPDAESRVSACHLAIDFSTWVPCPLPYTGCMV